jgi:hypothetical protein
MTDHPPGAELDLNAVRDRWRIQTTWLLEREQRAGVNHGWRARVSERLRRGHDKLGESWRDRSLAELLLEAREECEDTGGWGVLARATLLAAGLDELTTNEILGHLEDAVELAARADNHLSQAIALADSSGHFTR